MNIAIVDVETTGLPQKHPYARIIEVGAVVLDEEGCIVSTFESLVRTELRSWDSEAEAEKLHKITQEMWIKAPHPADVARSFRRWLVRRHVSRVTSYKTAFDFHPFLLGDAHWLGNSGLTLAPCLMKLASARWNNGDKLSLEDALTAAGVTPNSHFPAHTALGDAVNAAKLASQLLPELVQEVGTPLLLDVLPQSGCFTRADYARLQAEGRVS